MLIMLVAWLMDGAREAMLPQAGADMAVNARVLNSLRLEIETHTKPKTNPKAQIGSRDY